ncbi:MAG: signal peptidase [Nocardioides sp.]|nr:signal peptidase [Nocardioides sp.]
MTRSAVLRSAREVALTAGAILGVLCIVVMLAGATLGVRPLVFRSGSMAPAIDTGALALSRTVPAAELRRGDIVSVLDAGGTRVTHRVVNVAAQGERRQLTLQGDANDKPDTEVYTVTEAQRVLFHVPRLGYVVGWLTGPIGIFLLGLYAALLLSVVFRGERPGPGGPPSPTRRPPARRRAAPVRRRRLPATLSLAVAAVGVLWPAPGWAAPWTDSIEVAGTPSTAAVVPPPVVSCSGLSVGSATLNWTAVTGATNYRIHYGGSGGTTETVPSSVTSKVFSGLVTSGQFSVEALRNFGSVTWESVTSNKKNYSVLLFLVSTCPDP